MKSFNSSRDNLEGNCTFDTGMKVAVVVMILYSVSMVFYGTLEVGHDFLHYLAAHHHSTIHNHEHGHAHGVRDHHGHHHHHKLNHHAELDEEANSLPSGLNFFLFFQPAVPFQFENKSGLKDDTAFSTDRNSILLQPPIPPPRQFLHHAIR